jgi:DNA-binding transcriptional LysR family regulator
MLLRQLVYLRALSRERHFGRAATACGVSQPTLSAAIKQLETELAVPIVQRGQRGLSMVPRLTTPFHARHPSVALSVLSQTSQQIQRALDNFEIDIGVTYLDNEPLANVQTLPFYRERYVLVTPSDSAVGRHRKISWAEAAELPLSLLTPDMQNRRILNDLFRQVSAKPHTVIETNSVATLWAHLRQGVVERHAPNISRPFRRLRGFARHPPHRPGSQPRHRPDHGRSRTPVTGYPGDA